MPCETRYEIGADTAMILLAAQRWILDNILFVLVAGPPSHSTHSNVYPFTNESPSLCDDDRSRLGSTNVTLSHIRHIAKTLRHVYQLTNPNKRIKYDELPLSFSSDPTGFAWESRSSWFPVPRGNNLFSHKRRLCDGRDFLAILEIAIWVPQLNDAQQA